MSKVAEKIIPCRNIWSNLRISKISNDKQHKLLQYNTTLELTTTLYYECNSKYKLNSDIIILPYIRTICDAKCFSAQPGILQLYCTNFHVQT